ncbi:MAG: ABC transporter ATP-binding protein [Candidatus Omnitrophica bacterium]|nr:ABC transporter ATP-binding protein [Candidatus Omnitrophota bacterium]
MLFQFLMRSQWRLLALVAVASLLAAALEGAGLSMCFPLFQGSSMDLGPNVPVFMRDYLGFFEKFALADRMRLIACLLVIIVFVKLLVMQWNIVLVLRLRNEVVRHYRREAVRALFSTGMSRFNKKRISDLNLIIDGFVDQHVAAIVDLVGNTLQYFFTSFVLLAVLLCLSLKMTFVAFLVVAVGGWALSFMSAVIYRHSLRLAQTKSAFNQTLFDLLHGLKVIRVFGREQMMAERFDQTVVDSNESYAQSTTWTLMVGPIFEFIGAVIIAGILLAGAFLLGSGGMTIGVVLTFLIILVRMIPPFKALNHARGALAARMPSLKIVEALIEEKGDDVIQGEVPFDGLRQQIEIAGLSFRYEAGGPQVLNDVSLVIPKGARVGIAGTSGAGKSTFVELLLRLYDPSAGRILVDGRNIQEYSRSSWLAKVGVVAQDPFLFNDTIRANIAFAKPGATDQEVEAAAHKAYAHGFIQAFPLGYDTLVGERGALISGGQRQRIAIARAILRDPEIFLFDEATSALDAESEACVQKAINEISSDKTVITIAHRLSTLTGSDMIIVFEQGRVAQCGRHHELLTMDGAYRRFVETQTI